MSIYPKDSPQPHTVENTAEPLAEERDTPLGIDQDGNLGLQHSRVHTCKYMRIVARGEGSLCLERKEVVETKVPESDLHEKTSLEYEGISVVVQMEEANDYANMKSTPV